MSESNQFQAEWTELVEQYNESLAEAVEQNVEAQATLLESWTEAVEDSLPEEEVLAEGIEGYNRAYEVWMDAAEEVLQKSVDAAEGEDVEPREIRDIWLQSANQAFKEVMSTSAFASANGRLVTAMLEAQREVDEVNQESLARFGFATRDDVEEVGERLVELERRQHDVEDKLDRILDELEG
jgi:hypothetical protein